MPLVDRRTFLAGSAGLFLPCLAAAGTSKASTTMVVTKDPNCGCCSAWVDHVRSAGFEVEVIESNDLVPLKRRLGVPVHLAACHTAEIGGYVLEGHVPAAAIKRFLAERPSATGLAVPGMPVGSPGMEVSGSPDERYEVILFGPTGHRVYARFLGHRELS
jgi:hypothetical protein